MSLRYSHKKFSFNVNLKTPSRNYNAIVLTDTFITSDNYNAIVLSSVHLYYTIREACSNLTCGKTITQIFQTL